MIKYDVIVVGGGHAGIEACLSTSRMNKKTLLITSNIKNIADMPCNPSIGGSAKGIVVREIDALGGEMGISADKSLIQIKMLNNSKGPAVRSLRAQIDKSKYHEIMLKTLKKQKNLEIKQGMVESLLVEDQKAIGVVLQNGEKINSKAVILTTGTYLKANILVGDSRKEEGPHGESPSMKLSDDLRNSGFEIIRLKTGTPPRIKTSSINFSLLKEEKGDDEPLVFSYDNKVYYDFEKQISCYLTYTNEKTHKIIRGNLNKSSMYGGFHEKLGVGPRYCPSIEDKIVKFAEKERHQLFLEPEEKSYDTVYLQGFSTSMPKSIQEEMVRSLKGLENAEILKYAYAIEYDAINPTQLKLSLETKIIENLFTAGQINGTSGYEEAAAQGIIAGINAVQKIDNKGPFILQRSEAYIGVMIDDLVTKGTEEPYRLLTSRAEYRLLLRSDNADQRLSKKSYELGLLSKKRYKQLLEKEQETKKIIQELKKITIPKYKTNLYEHLRKSEEKTSNYIDKFKIKYSKEALEQVEIGIKYEGYINKARKEVEKIKKYEEKEIPRDVDYNKIKNIATEARQKLIKIRPYTIGQASRISGINPTDITMLLVYLKRYYNE